MSKIFIYCTLTNSHIYTNWTRPADPNFKPEAIVDKEKGVPVHIQGGANLATSPESERGRHTPKGVVTEVTEVQLEYLRQNTSFIRHEKQGWILVIHSAEDPNKVAADMSARDRAAPLHPNSPEFQGVGEDTVKPMGKLDKAVEAMKVGAEGFKGMFR